MTADLGQLTSWHAAGWRGLKVGVLGAAVVGFAAADTLVELGCEVLVVGERVTEERATLLDVIGARVRSATRRRSATPCGRSRPTSSSPAPASTRTCPRWRGRPRRACRCSATSSSPGASATRTGEPADWITITGTNGKTTTTQLTTAMLREGGLRARACGNIGSPVLDAIREPDGWDVLVVELSSYQLHWMEEVSPAASVCLNIADDHLDWHGSAEAYRAAKGRVYERTRLACVFNVEDPATEQLVRDADVVEGCRAIGFGRGVPRVSEVGIVEEVLVDRAFLEQRQTSALELTTLHALDEAGLSAPHVVADVLAAAALARAVGVDPARDPRRARGLPAGRAPDRAGRRGGGGPLRRRLEGHQPARRGRVARRVRQRRLGRGRPHQGGRRGTAGRGRRRLGAAAGSPC